MPAVGEIRACRPCHADIRDYLPGDSDLSAEFQERLPPTSDRLDSAQFFWRFAYQLAVASHEYAGTDALEWKLAIAEVQFVARWAGPCRGGTAWSPGIDWEHRVSATLGTTAPQALRTENIGDIARLAGHTVFPRRGDAALDRAKEWAHAYRAIGARSAAHGSADVPIDMWDLHGVLSAALEFADHRTEDALFFVHGLFAEPDGPLFIENCSPGVRGIFKAALLLCGDESVQSLAPWKPRPPVRKSKNRRV